MFNEIFDELGLNSTIMEIIQYILEHKDVDDVDPDDNEDYDSRIIKLLKEIIGFILMNFGERMEFMFFFKTCFFNFDFILKDLRKVLYVLGKVFNQMEKEDKR